MKRKALKIPDIISEEELIKILKITKKKHHKLAFVLGFYACMRVSEITKLRPENLDKGRKLIMIKEAKFNKDRNIPIPPQAMRGLSNIPLKCGIRALQIAIKKYGKAAIEKNIHFHTLRHSGATHYLVKKRWSLRHIQRFLGHASLQSTQIYTHVTTEDLVERMWE